MIYKKNLLVICILLTPIYSQDILGDVNQDGSVDILDLVRTVNIILEVPPPPTEYELWAADVNADTDINILDVVVEVEFILGDLQLNCADENEYLEPCTDNLTNCCYPITSHEFEWEVTIFGEGASDYSELYGIDIVNQNDIWIAGTIIKPDSLIDSPTDYFYNAIHFNGEEWQEFTLADTNQLAGWGYSFFVFDENDMWFGSSRPMHFNGENWNFYGANGDYNYPEYLGHIDHIWGTSFDNMFFFNSTADVVHWDGEQFTLMQTSTGSGDGWAYGSTYKNICGKDENHIWALSRGSIGSPMSEFPHTIQFFDGNEWTDLYRYDNFFEDDDTLSPYLYNMWQFEDSLYVMAGWELWRESITTGIGYYTPLDSGIYSPPHFVVGKGLVGNHPNDMVTISWQGKFAHFNGENWGYNTDIYEYLESATIGYAMNIAYKGDTIIIHGGFYGFDNPVWVARGRRID